jgi:hypothetical protein
MSFATRERFSLADARASLAKGSNAILHLLDNQDGTFSIMSHINCEHCDYCDEFNVWYAEQKAKGLQWEEISKLEDPAFIAKEDPYAIQKIKMPENYV